INGCRRRSTRHTHSERTSCIPGCDSSEGQRRRNQNCLTCRPSLRIGGIAPNGGRGSPCWDDAGGATEVDAGGRSSNKLRHCVCSARYNRRIGKIPPLEPRDDIAIGILSVRGRCRNVGQRDTVVVGGGGELPRIS